MYEKTIAVCYGSGNPYCDLSDRVEPNVAMCQNFVEGTQYWDIMYNWACCVSDDWCGWIPPAGYESVDGLSGKLQVIAEWCRGHLSSVGMDMGMHYSHLGMDDVIPNIWWCYNYL